MIECKNDKPSQILFGLEVAISSFSIAGGFGPATRTCGIRAVRIGYPSFHPMNQARDIRNNDKPDKWTNGVVLIIQGFQQIDRLIQYVVHGKDMNRHIHIEYDTGDPK